MKKGKEYARAKSEATQIGRPPIAGACAALSDWEVDEARLDRQRHAPRRPRGALRREREDAGAGVQEDGRDEGGDDRMSAHRPFTDRAGYTRHCWECVHAKDWEERPVNGDRAMCDATGAHVYKFDSPNNPCSHLPSACEYERRAK